MKLSIEEIKNLVERKKYKQASDLAMTLNWQKVKDWSALSAAITAHENAGELEEARDMAILAYNRNLGGKKLVYELTTLMMKLKQFEEADELFLEYEKMASRDVNRYILYYELRKAEGAPSNELVEILEDYKKEEIDEKYMYELAKLYSKTGRKKECVKACDEIALLFQDGTYVVKALKMKQFHGAPLTEVQQQKLDEAKARRADMEITREILFQQQMDTTRFTENQEAEINEMIDGTSASRDTVDVGSMLKEARNQAAMDDDVDYTEFETELDENGVNRKLKRFILAKVQEAEEAKKAEAGQTGDAVKEAAVNTENGQADGNVGADADVAEGSVNDDSADTFTATAEGSAQADYTDADSETAVAAENGVTVEGSQGADGTVADGAANAGAPSEEEPAKIGEMPESLKDLIANAKKKIESSYDKITKESEQEKLEQERAEAERQMRAREDAMQIEEVAVPGNNIYDTQNLQAEIARNLSAVLDDDDLDQDVEMFRPNPVPTPVNSQDEEVNTEDEQIEGQMSIADWMETVREEKYGSQNTKEYSKSELDRLLDQKEENSAAYEKLLEEKKLNKQMNLSNTGSIAAGMLMEAKTDLAIRTGKATQKLEEAVENLKEAAAVAGEINNMTQAENVSYAQTSDSEPAANESVSASDEVTEAVQRELTASVERVSLDTAKLDVVPEQVIAQYVEKEMAAAKPATRKVSPKAAAEKIEAAKPVKEVKDLKLDSNLARYFKKYREMPGLETQLAEYFSALPSEMADTTSRTGNILISGNSSSDKYDLAKAIVRAINSIYPDNPKKIARTTGESINYRGIAKSMSRLHGTVLVVEGAGVIQPKRVQELMECMEQDTGRMIVILEDADTEINVLLNFNPDLAKMFNHRIILKQYTVNELVEMARKFARRRSYEVDDDALLELYLRIDKLHAVTDNIKLDDVKEIINQAIEHSEKRASRKLFKGIKKKHTENGDLIYLTESDFRE